METPFIDPRRPGPAAVTARPAPDAPSADGDGRPLRPVFISALEQGQVFDRPLVTGDGQTLLREGQPLSAELIAWLARGTVNVYAPDASESDLSATPRRVLWEQERQAALCRGELRRTADDLAASKRERWNTLPLRVDSVNPPGVIASAREARRALGAEELAARSNVWCACVLRALDEGAGDAGVMTDLAWELLDAAARAPGELLLDVLAQDALDPGSAEALGDHAVRSGALAALLAARLGWGDTDAIDAVLTALLADSGMTLVPLPVRDAARPLVDEEFNQVRRHPSYSAAVIERLNAPGATSRIPERVQLAVYQHHERDNARGYPELRAMQRIHDLARLAGVCDMFVGIISARAHRPAQDPAIGVRELVHGAARGEVSGRVVRALVDVCGVYPPGARVRLSTGHAGEVVVRGPGNGLRPVVRVLSTRGPDYGRTVDLARTPVGVRVVGPLAA